MNTGIKLTVLLSTCCLSLSAQENSFYAGIRLGGGYSINNHIDRILVSENYYSNYSFDNKGLFVPSAELFSFTESREVSAAWKQASPITTRQPGCVTKTGTS